MSAPARCDVIFDLDDTLIASFEGYCAAHRRTARELGLPVLSFDELIDYDQDFPATLRRHYPEFEPLRFIAKWEEVADEYPYQAIRGVTSALRELREEGHRLWIVTSRSRTRLLQRMTQGELSVEWFDGVYPRDDQPHQKPHPDCFAPVWRAMGDRRPQVNGSRWCPRVVYVGDRRCDQQAAEAARIEFVAVRTGPEARRGFPVGVPSERVLASAAEVPAWIHRWQNGSPR